MTCRCDERFALLEREIPPGSNDRPRAWIVLRRNESCSAFTGYRKVWSDYSDVMCRVCGEFWRTKARYVEDLKDSEGWPEKHPSKLSPIPHRKG